MKKTVSHVVIVMGLLAAVVMFGLTDTRVSASPAPPAAPQALDSKTMAMSGVILEDPAGPSKLTKAQVLEVVRSIEPTRSKGAAHVSARRIMFHNPYTSQLEPAWLVTLDGTSVKLHGPNNRENYQANIVVSEDGEPLIRFSYQ